MLIEKFKKYVNRNGGSPVRALVRRFTAMAYSNAFFRKMYVFNRRAAEPKKWIFLVGCYNSGTTILRDVLSTHPDISGLPREGAKFTESLPRPEDFGWTRMWIGCIEKMCMPSGERGAKLAKNARRDWSCWWDDSCDCFLEKSVSNTTRIEWINENFENVYFLGITRDPVPVVEGIRRKAKPKGRAKQELNGEVYPIDLVAKQWVDANQKILDGKKKVNRFYHMKYEDFVDDPILHLDEILNFLGLAGINMEMERSMLTIGEDRIEIVNMNKRSEEKISIKDKELILEIAGDLAHEFGYS